MGMKTIYGLKPDIHFNDWIIFPYLRVYVEYEAWGFLFGWLFIEFNVSWNRKDPYYAAEENCDD